MNKFITNLEISCCVSASELTSHDLAEAFHQRRKKREVDYLKLGRRVKHFREKAGLSQIQLAEKAMVSRPYVSQIENGVFNTSLETIITVALLSRSPSKLQPNPRQFVKNVYTHLFMRLFIWWFYLENVLFLHLFSMENVLIV